MSLLERTLSDIARPRWEGTPGFGPCWDRLVRGAQDLRWDRSSREFCVGLLPIMASCRVLTIEAVQVDQLPNALAFTTDDEHTWYSDAVLEQALSKISVPFEHLFLDTGGCQMLGRDSTDTSVIGVLMSFGDSGGCRLTPFVTWGDTNCTPLGTWESGVGSSEPQVVDASRLDHSGYLAIPSNSVRYDAPIAQMVAGESGQSADKAMAAFLTCIGFAAERAVAVLQWLESVNVEIVDQTVSRQVRRQAERTGAEIAKVVRVKLPKSWRNGQPPQRHGKIEYSHRFERRGHYKFHSASTRLGRAKPEKLSYVPERDGYFRRIWCPSHVVGPSDKPLVLKTRKLIARKPSTKGI